LNATAAAAAHGNLSGEIITYNKYNKQKFQLLFRKRSMNKVL